MSAMSPGAEFRIAMEGLGVTPINKDYKEWNACRRKIRYPLFSIAQKHARTATNRECKRIIPYPCEICHGFHIGHKEVMK